MNILMICLGNICRSPLAEGILKDKTKEMSNIFVDSAGTASYHVGNLPDVRSIEIAEKHNINLRDQRARQFSIADFDNFDKIYVMDESNLRDVLSLARNNDDREKVDLILNELEYENTKSVPDPYYGGENGFINVFNLLDKACESIAKRL